MAPNCYHYTFLSAVRGSRMPRSPDRCVSCERGTTTSCSVPRPSFRRLLACQGLRHRPPTPVGVMSLSSHTPPSRAHRCNVGCTELVHLHAPCPLLYGCSTRNQPAAAGDVHDSVGHTLHLRRGTVVVQTVPHMRHWPLRRQCLCHDAIKVLGRQASTSVRMPRALHCQCL